MEFDILSPARARDGNGILLGNGAKRNEPKDTVDSPVNGGEAKRSHRAGAMIKGMRKQIERWEMIAAQS